MAAEEQQRSKDIISGSKPNEAHPTKSIRAKKHAKDLHGKTKMILAHVCRPLSLHELFNHSSR